VCAEAGALPEAAGGAALLLDPRAEDEWGEAIRSLLTEPERRSALQERAVARREELHRYRMGAALAELYGKVLGPATAG
jgi:glycosyltransferase involved in cell wall biosynthesis